MELEKIKSDINVSSLIDELSEIVKLKLEEDTVVSKYKKLTALKMAIENLSPKYREIAKEKSQYKVEMLEIEIEIINYQSRAKAFSEFWKPEKLIEAKEKEEFKNEERFKRVVINWQVDIEISISNEEYEVRNARATLKKYKAK